MTTTLLRSRPELRGRIALADYKRGKVSLARAAEIAGVDQERFKDLLREAGIDRYLEPIEDDALNHEVEQLMTVRADDRHAITITSPDIMEQCDENTISRHTSES